MYKGIKEISLFRELCLPSETQKSWPVPSQLKMFVAIAPKWLSHISQLEMIFKGWCKVEKMARI
jgi:hypothetical protein